MISFIICSGTNHSEDTLHESLVSLDPSWVALALRPLKKKKIDQGAVLPLSDTTTTTTFRGCNDFLNIDTCTLSTTCRTHIERADAHAKLNTHRAY